MPKKLFAVTNIKVGNDAGEFFVAGTEIDVAKFSRETLLELHEAGAVEVRTVDAEPEAAPHEDFEAAVGTTETVTATTGVNVTTPVVPAATVAAPATPAKSTETSKPADK